MVPIGIVIIFIMGKTWVMFSQCSNPKLVIVMIFVLFQVVNAWYNGPVAGRFGCFSFAMFGMLGGLAQVFQILLFFSFSNFCG